MVWKLRCGEKEGMKGMEKEERCDVEKRRKGMI